jgi:hypothetical protein
LLRRFAPLKPSVSSAARCRPCSRSSCARPWASVPSTLKCSPDNSTSCSRCSDHLVEERHYCVTLDQAPPILDEHGRRPYRLIHRQSDEPAEQPVVPGCSMSWCYERTLHRVCSGMARTASPARCSGVPLYTSLVHAREELVHLGSLTITRMRRRGGWPARSRRADASLQ